MEHISICFTVSFVLFSVPVVKKIWPIFQKKNKKTLQQWTTIYNYGSISSIQYYSIMQLHLNNDADKTPIIVFRHS